MTSITDNERALLTAIRDNELHDGADRVNGWVYVDDCCAAFGTSAGGIMASLEKKGLASTDGECCCIRQAGFDAIK